MTDVETHARRAADIAKLGYWDADFNGNILSHSKGYVLAHGWPADTVITTQAQIYDVIHPEDVARVQSEFERVDRDGVDYEIEYRVIRPTDGEIGYVREIGELVHDADGDPIGHSGTTQDVTRERLVEARLKRALAEAESNLQARDLFLANMSHELRTPLNAIGGYAELLGLLKPEELSEEKARSYATAIHQASNHLSDIISDILLQAELQRDIREIDVREINARDLIDDVIGISGLRLNKNFDRLSVDTTTDNDCPIFHGDLRLIRQALINILGNAVKYAGLDRGITIGFRCNEEDCRLFVADNGEKTTGLDAEKLAEPFYRGQSALQKAIPGTGLGLSLVNQIMELHGGHLAITPGREKGLVVSLVF